MAEDTNPIWTRLSSIISNAVICVLVGGLIWISIGEYRLRNQFTTQNELLGEWLSTLQKHVDDQTAVMNRALGKTIPVVMPSDWEKHLADAEAHVSNRAQWPKDQKNAQAYFDAVTRLVKSLPAWAEPDYLTRISAVRWSALAFVRLSAPVESSAMLASADELRELGDDIPDGGSKELKSELQKTADDRTAKAHADQFAAAKTTADAFIKGNSWSEEEAANADNILQRPPKSEQDAASILELRSKLHILIQSRQAAKNALALRSRLNKLRLLKEKDPVVYETGLQMLYSEAMAARTAIAIDDIQVPEYVELEGVLREALTELGNSAAKREEDRQGKAMRDYQRWVLDCIKNFESRYASIGDDAVGNSRYVGIPNGPRIHVTSGWGDQQHADVAAAMEKFLLPINEALLDAPVRERYQRAFQQGWETLKGREDQNHVAEAVALAIKKPLRDFFEETIPKGAAQRAYDDWVGKEVADFSSVFNTVLEDVAKRRSIEWKNVVQWGDWEGARTQYILMNEVIQKKLLTGWDERDRAQVEEAMIEHLLPVNPDLLSQEWRRVQFKRTYEMGRKQLSDAETNKLNEQIKTTKMKRIEDFMEK